MASPTNPKEAPMTAATEYYAELNIHTADGEFLTYYSNASQTPAEALQSAKTLALAEHPQGRVLGHRVWGD